jgi:hypothetical protein
MSTRVSASNLAQAAKSLNAEWENTKAYWRDAKSAEFEQKYLEELPSIIGQAINVMEEMDALCRKVRNDCE